METINPNEREESTQDQESEEEKPNFPPYCQYSLGFSFLAMIILSIMSLFA
ncbi:MAG: hypothetical protein R6U96_09540 [Promethearchaeia archaeon]